MIKKLLISSALLFAPLGAAAAEPVLRDADPAMWTVKDEDTTVYLFGTFHLLDGTRDWFNDEVKAAFDASDALVLEAVVPDDPAELQPLIMRYAIDPEGRSLSSQLSTEEQARLATALADVGAPAAAFDQFEPWFVSMTLAILAVQKLGVTGEYGPEAILQRAAAARGMGLVELEGVEHQLEFLDGMPREMQLRQLRMTLEEFEDMDEKMAPMLAAWTEGQVERLVGIMNEQIRDHPELFDILFAQRNARWAEWIASRLAQPGTVFVAVGAGHLAGDHSVQRLLAERGIIAERIGGS